MVKTRKKTKVYGKDEYKPYTIHKCTLISYDSLLSCKTIIKLFGQKNVSKIQIPPDPALAKRGIKWVRFKTGGKAEFHFVPPFALKDNKTLRRMVKKQDKQDPLKSQFYENHVGVYVPDLTDVVIHALEQKLPCQVTRRADGMHQFYVDIPGCLDYLDVDSLKLDMDKVHKKYPNFKESSFASAARYTKKLQTKQRKKVKKERRHATKKIFQVKKFIYEDPKHNNALRRVTLHKNGKMNITGKDTPHGKIWKIKGTLDKKNNAILDFSSKGGPKNIKAKVTATHVKFSDGNTWKAPDFYT